MTWSILFDVAFNVDPEDEPTGGDWTDLSSRATSKQPVEVQLGTGRLSGRSPGSASLILDNTDRAIDPTNTSATYNLVPFRHARLRAVVDATTYPLFRGFVDAWPPAWSSFDSWVNVRLVDGFAWLALKDADLDLPVQMSHDRVTALLDLAGWPAALRDIGDGVVELEAYEQNSSNIYRTLIDTADAENGDLYVAPDGKITFRSRHNRFDATPDITFGESGVAFSAASPAWDTTHLTNTARVELEDGRVFEAIDDASVTAYGTRVLPTRDLPLRAVEAYTLAQWDIVRWGEPHLWVDQLVIESSETGALPAMIQRQVGDLAAIDHVPPAGAAVDVQLNIERVRHTIGDVLWTTTFDLSPYFGEGPWFTWDEPALGWDLDAKWAP